MKNSTSLVKIDISLTKEELILEQIPKSDIKLTVPSSFQSDIAWELANLNRIAYKDYELFDGSPKISIKDAEWGSSIFLEGDNKTVPIKIEHTLQEGYTLYVRSTTLKMRINDYIIDASSTKDKNSTLQHKVQEIFNEDFYEYKILKAYNYLAYSFDTQDVLTMKADVDKFGFVAERISKDGSKLIFVVFRGTREPEEWFNNVQFKQIPFLMQSKVDNSVLLDRTLSRISLGFNKIYTDYRPAVFMGDRLKNNIAIRIDEQSRKKSKKKYPDEHKLHSQSIFFAIEDCFKNSQQFQDAHIYLTGHSLGGALATICALHIANMLNHSLTSEGRSKIFLYSFASPRVGNPSFASECNKKFITFRITNSEDIVPTVPPATFKVIGQEMLSDAIVSAIRKHLDFVSRGITKDINNHVGYPIYFTRQVGEISSNHNMGATYCGALENIE